MDLLHEEMEREPQQYLQELNQTNIIKNVNIRYVFDK